MIKSNLFRPKVLKVIHEIVAVYEILRILQFENCKPTPLFSSIDLSPYRANFDSGVSTNALINYNQIFMK